MGNPPQLVMRREGFGALPRVRMEFGYLVRTYRPGDAELWCRLAEGNIGKGWKPERFVKEILGAPQFDPRGLFFVTFGSRAAGTALAWRAALEENGTGDFAAIAVAKHHRGRGVGGFLTVKVLEYLRDAGFSACRLRLDETRLAAVKACLRIGFRPAFEDGGDRARWQSVLEKLGRPIEHFV